MTHDNSSLLHRKIGIPYITRIVVLIVATLLLVACVKTRQAGFGNPIEWTSISGWEQDNHAEVWPALLNNCRVLANDPVWTDICTAAESLEQPDDAAAKNFFETRFVARPLYANGGEQNGLITGYYEPLLLGSRVADGRFRYPVYRAPTSLLTINLSSLYPTLTNKRIRGRKVDNTIVPFYSRQEIEANRDLLFGDELLWIDDRDAVFFLHIQGSGRVQLPDGNIVGVGYSDQNGHPYVAIGRILIRQGELSREETSLFTIRQWLHDHPQQATALLNENPSYVFFTLRENPEKGPIGSLNTPLTPQRSLAIDPKLVKLGTPIWLSTNYPQQPNRDYSRLVFAQDTGGAIKGTLRADLFWGHGEEAEWSAGNMKESGSLIVLLPK